ncbi:MAG: right-handed parallel beta-helix repeat-containing protein [Bacteroidota bacterium]
MVYPAMYFESIDFKGKDIVVGSLYLLTVDTSYIGWTVINGNHEQNRLVKFVHGETRKASLIGFTITNAFDNIGAATVKISGLAIYIENSSPTIDHNYIVNNEFGEWYISGGGIVMMNSGAKISNNRITGNNYAFEGGGIYAEGGTDQIIENNIISKNELTSGYGVARGGGIFMRITQRAIIQNNNIEDNILDFGYGSAIYMENCDSTLILNNKFQNNKSLIIAGEVQLILSSGKLVNSLLYNSMYPNRGLLKFESSSFKVINSTIVNKSEAAVTLINSNVHFINTILYGVNDSVNGKRIKLVDSEAIFTNCDIEGDTTGFELTGNSSYLCKNNISADPYYLGTGKEPFSLAVNSPCINKGLGDTNVVILPLTDLAGEARIAGQIVDIGAYENQLVESIKFDEGIRKMAVYPNPANEWISVENKYDNLSKKIMVRIYNAEGLFVAENEWDGFNRINVGNFKPGFYILVADTIYGKVKLKFVKQ